MADTLKELQDEWDVWMERTYTDNRGRTKQTVAENWRGSNPVEWQKLQDYRAYKIGKPTLATSMGKQMVEHVEGWQSAKEAPAPIPEPPPPDPPPAGGGTISPSEFASRAVAGATIQNVTVTGNCSVNAANVTVKDSVIQGRIAFKQGATNAKMLNCTAVAFNIESADGVTVDHCTLDGKGTAGQCFIWANPAPNPINGFTLTNNLFQNFYAGGGAHCEALYIGGYARDGLIEGNTFYNNGNTAHIFVTWCAPNDCDNTGANPDARDPKNICIKGNTFKETWQAYFAIMVRQESNAPNGHGIYSDDNIKIEPGQPFVNRSLDPGFGVHGVIFLGDDNMWAANAYKASPC